MADDVASLGLRVESQQVVDATRNMDRMSQSARGLQQNVQGVSQSSERLTASQNSVIRQLETMIGRTQLAGRELAQFNALRRAGTTADTEAGRAIAALAGIHHDLDRQQQRRAAVTERITGLLLRQITATLALVAASYSLASIRSSVDETGRIGDVSDRLKVSTDLIQVFRLQMQLAGGSISEADAVLDKFARSAGEAMRNTGFLVTFLKANNVELAKFNSLNIDQKLLTVVDLISRIKDAEQQVDVSQKIFGRGSREAVAVMQGGIEGLLKLYDEMISKNQILSKQTITEGQRIDDAFTKLADRLDKGFKKSVIDTIATVELWGNTLTVALDKVGGASNWTRIINYLNQIARLMNPFMMIASSLGLITAVVSGAGKGGEEGILRGGAEPKTGNVGGLRALLTGTGGTGETRVPTAKVRADDYERLAKSTRKAIVELEAEAAMADRGAMAVAAHKKQEELLNAALEAKRKITPALLLQIDELADAYGRAAEAAARAKITADTFFERATLGLTDQEAKIAQSLRPIFGSDIAAALNSAEAAAMRFNEQLKVSRDLATEFATGFTRDFVSSLREGANAWDAFRKAGMNALNRLTDKLLEMAAQKLAQRAFGGALGALGIGGGAPNLGTDAGSSTAFSFHSGGLVGVSGTPRYVHPAYYDDAPRMHNGGTMGGIDFAGGERPAVLLEGERVLKRGERWGSSPVNNLYIENYGAEVEAAEPTQNETGGTDWRILVRRAVSEDISQGQFDTPLKARYPGVSAGVAKR